MGNKKRKNGAEADSLGWKTMRADTSLRLLEGMKEASEVFLGCKGNNLKELLDKESLSFFRERVSLIRKSYTADAFILKDCNGNPLEFLVTNELEAIRIFCRRLRRHRERDIFSRHFLTTPLAICYTDEFGNILNANSSFLDLYGYTIEEVRGRNPRILKSGRQSPEIYSQLWESITDPEVGHWTGEIINRKKNGKEVTVLLSIASVRSVEGNLLGYVASTLDVSWRKRMERELRDKNKTLEELIGLKSDLMAITSHDLKAPINAMINYADLVYDDLDHLDPDQVRGYMERISNSGKRLTQFITDLLDLGRIEQGRFALNLGRVNLESVLRSSVDTNHAFGLSVGVAVRMNVKKRPPPLRADSVKLEQVFNNVISNAVKFSPKGSEVTATLDVMESGKAVVTIEDRGSGIPEDDLKHIFDPYYQVKKKGAMSKRTYGAGLGLSIVKQIVELHNGMVRADNRPDGGCGFTITLPMLGLRAEEMAALIVDGSSTIFSYVEEPLKRKGLACYMVKTLAEAERVADHESPELIFVNCDKMQPETRKFLHKVVFGEGRKAAVIGISSVKVEEKDFGSGLFFDVLTTPVTDMELIDIVDKVEKSGYCVVEKGAGE